MKTLASKPGPVPWAPARRLGGAHADCCFNIGNEVRASLSFCGRAVYRAPPLGAALLQL